ncbi:type IV pilin-like G/H family protein [Trichormus azollae]|uniref:type IV pilin-like G/H family protein n=1 Tax=Trichormus azollae TaxID=1164 RepID=UPI00325D7AE0
MAFTTSIAELGEELGVGIQQQMENYQYLITLNNTVATNNSVSKKVRLNSYAGITYLNSFMTPAGTTELVI